MKNKKTAGLNNVKVCLLYIPIFVAAFVVVSILWYFFVDGVFYYCSDKVSFIDLIPPFVHGKNFGDYFIAPPFVVYGLWTVFLFTLFLLPLLLLKYFINRKTNPLTVILSSLSIPVLLFIGFFIYGLKNSSSLPPTAPPSWDSPTAVYTIKKEHENYLIHYNINSDNGDYFVGNSNVDLADFVDKKVVIKGNFPRNFEEMMANLSNTQCIQGLCHKIFNSKIWEEQNQNTSVINIDEIYELIDAKPRDKIVDYVVVDGDTLDDIAEKFGISSDTVRWANELLSVKVFPGQILKILPVTGIMHTAKSDETVENIAKKYKTTAQKIIDYPYNHFADDKYSLTAGQMLIVPNGVK